MDAIELQGISRSFDIAGAPLRVLDQLDLRVTEREIVAIVGPNGSGKSNIADALRWVLGEQSAKQLRGSSMEDVIFNGTEARGPSGMSEVTFTLDLRGGNAPPQYAEYDEVSVTRRLHRDGTSEYFIQKVPVRLQDIRELFLDTGIGVDAYSVIEQGRVDVLLFRRPVRDCAAYDFSQLPAGFNFLLPTVFNNAAGNLF